MSESAVGVNFQSGRGNKTNDGNKSGLYFHNGFHEKIILTRIWHIGRIGMDV